ncbi:ATP-binding protein [Streptomyces sp. TP-A0356]|uniref:ATP-binding protein n=1 Tax=Streptomyces sp. TP-A0356 TaxID=1359208 RepID=UPI0007C7C3FC|nr:ATP-binding protein [Streptomyces sp. TP-A0356]
MLPAHTPQETMAIDAPAWHVPDADPFGRGRAIERHMVLVAVLPAGLVAVTGAAACALLSTAGGSHADKGAFWGLLTGTLLVVGGILTGAGLFAARKARALGRRYTEVSSFAVRGQAELAQLRLQLERSQELMERRRGRGSPLPDQAGDALDRLGDEIASAWHTAQETAQGPAEQPRGGEHFEVFANMARRLESLVHREIGLLDDLENEVENPDLLKGLFRVDHLATRIRRYAENLAVLGGAVSHRLWTQPVSMSDVMRSAAAEIEQYARVKMVPPVEGTVSGHAVVDVVHLLAELVENATVFSPPHTEVLLRAEHVTAGLAIEVEDRGLGMTSAERNQMNSLLGSPDGVVLGELLKDGRIGLYVVSALARRHGIAVRLQNNVYGGTQAVVVLPHELLGRQQEVTEQQQPSDIASPAPRTPPPTHGHAEDSAERARAREIPVASTSAPAPVAEPPLAPTAPSTPGDGRPSLPKRRRQEHLAPELREADQTDVVVEEAEHDPGLMAAFQTGVRRAERSEEAEDSRETDTTTSVGGHTRPDPAP